MKYLPLIAALTCLPAGAFAAAHADMTPMTAQIAGTDGSAKGTVTVTPTLSETYVITLDLTGLPAGELGVHLHEVGDCSAPDFASAGGHLAGDDDNTHGVMTAEGPHAGDLPNIMVAADGTAKVTFFNEELEMDDLTDADGTAFVVHSGPDDYASQPSGDSGDRIACGVFE